MVGAKHVPIPYSITLENACLPQVEDIIKAVRPILGRNRDSIVKQQYVLIGNNG
ncbi:MAG: hypothetical protein Q7J78_04160 [Clostridiales bacterium]|nr:hypothetical protein [Clostridiales bacterium]